jgi:pimeloyl-ACP methyl ester carboxylesterase
VTTATTNHLRPSAFTMTPAHQTVAAAAPMTGAAPVRFLDRPGGRIAYTDQGNGPLVVMAPGFGDLKEEFRFLAPVLVAAGYRAVTMDLRGHGQSSTGWDDYTCAAQGRDMLALVAHLDAGPAILIGESISGGSAAWAAAEAPDAVAGLVLIDPFARNVPISWLKAALFKTIMNTAFVGPWAPAAWGAFYGSLYPAAKPADFAAYTAAMVANLKEPGRMAAVKAMMRVGRDDVEPRLGAISAPALVVMGSRDPDFDDPAGEAKTMAKLVRGEVAMIDGAGHYPHAEMPEKTAAAIIGFLARLASR